ncbi:MAG: efflux RND transporter periplasmic adaptor subunit [Rhizobiales bacterium]|nr:efflux RND transporter periplasmic adaptor subunit [Hyphomicrobiales bacterium]
MICLVLHASLACLIVVVAGCSKNNEQSFQGWIEANLIFISPDEYGRIETQPVREGDRVEARTLLFTLDDDLQRAEVAEREATLKNAQQAHDRASTLMKTAAGTQKAFDETEAALRSAQARLNSSQTKLTRRKAFSPAAGTVQQIYFRVGELVPAGRPVVAILPPGNMKVRFFVSEAILPTIALDDTINIQCDGCPSGLTARISFIARTAEFTPPVIYSLEERNKLVFMIEALPEKPESLRVGQPVTVTLAPRGQEQAKQEQEQPNPKREQPEPKRGQPKRGQAK